MKCLNCRKDIKIRLTPQDPSDEGLSIDAEEYFGGYAEEYMDEADCDVYAVCACGNPTIAHKEYMKLSVDDGSPAIPDNLSKDADDDHGH